MSGWQREVADELLQQDIAAATDGNPSHRLASAAELAGQLRRIGLRRAELARQREIEQSSRQLQESIKRSRARRPWLFASVASLVAGLVASLWLYEQSRSAYLIAEEQKSRPTCALPIFGTYGSGGCGAADGAISEMATLAFRACEPSKRCPCN